MSGEERTTYGWVLRASCLPCTSLGLTGLGGGCCCHRLAEHGMQTMLPRATHCSVVEQVGPGSVRLRAVCTPWSLTSCLGSWDTVAWDGGCSLFLNMAQATLCLPASISWLLVRFFFLLAISPHHINHLSLVTPILGQDGSNGLGQVGQC